MKFLILILFFASVALALESFESSEDIDQIEAVAGPEKSSSKPPPNAIQPPPPPPPPPTTTLNPPTATNPNNLSAPNSTANATSLNPPREWMLPFYVDKAMNSDDVKDFKVSEFQGDLKSHAECRTLYCIFDNAKGFQALIVAMRKNKK